MKKEILLFQPEVPVKNPNYLPYSLLPVAGVLEEEGYKVGIVDTRFEDYRKLNLDDEDQKASGNWIHDMLKELSGLENAPPYDPMAQDVASRNAARKQWFEWWWSTGSK